MAESREPPFSKEKWGFFISASVIGKKAVQKRDGSTPLDLPFLSRR